MNPRGIALAQARGRIAVSAALLVAPSLGRLWIGRDAERGGTKVFTRAFGARDLALGLGVAIALDRGAPVRGWLEAGALADAADLVASWIARDDIPRAVLPLVTAVAAGSGVASAWLARELDAAPEGAPGQAPEAALTGHPA